MNRFCLVFAAAALALSAASSARATVMTTGCVSATACTLTELFAGGSIIVNDVSFTGWVKDNEADGDTDEDTVFVSGIDETATGIDTGELGLLFSADPAISFPVGEYQFSFDAAVAGTSSRTLTSATLSLLDADPGDDGFVEVSAVLTPGGLLTTSTDGAASASTALADLTALGLQPDFQMENRGTGSDPSLGQFSLAFEITGERDDGGQPIDEPATLALLLLGIAGIAAGSRRQRRRR